MKEYPDQVNDFDLNRIHSPTTINLCKSPGDPFVAAVLKAALLVAEVMWAALTAHTGSWPEAEHAE